MPLQYEAGRLCDRSHRVAPVRARRRSGPGGVQRGSGVGHGLHPTVLLHPPSGIGGGGGGTGEEDASRGSVPGGTEATGAGHATPIDPRGTAEAASDAGPATDAGRPEDASVLVRRPEP